MTIEANLSLVREELKDYPHVTLIVVSKNHPLESILEAYRLGVRDFGENRVQEALAKMEKAPHDIRWHFIGKLQRNKVAKVVGKFDLIHSVDTIELAEKISSESEKRGIVTRILLEANTSGEKSKSGLHPEEWIHAYQALLKLPGIRIEGLMTMAPLVEDTALIRETFSRLKNLSQKLQVSTLSMGMSHDYKIALQEGATLVRLGRVIF